MYDDNQVKTIDAALALMAEARDALENGTKHYRVSDGELLTTPYDIIRALKDEGQIEFVPQNNH